MITVDAAQKVHGVEPSYSTVGGTRFWTVGGARVAAQDNYRHSLYRATVRACCVRDRGTLSSDNQGGAINRLCVSGAVRGTDYFTG